MSFAGTALDVAGLPSRHPYTLGLSQSQIEQILAGWVEELGVPVRRGVEVTGFSQDDTGVDVQVADGRRRCARRTWSAPMVGAASSAGRPASSSSGRRPPGAT